MAKVEPIAVPPVEAVRYFRSKGMHVGWDWRDTEAEQHAVSFTVAKMMELDLLGEVQGAVRRAIEQGTTLAQFQDELEPLLKARGWWGNVLSAEHEGAEPEQVQLGSLHRLRTIFDTNIRTATAAGHWERIERLADQMPYLQYIAVEDARTRPLHAQWNGTVLPADHPWWKTHFPPNGWNCRCTVVQLSEEDLERYNLKVSPNPGTKSREWVNKRTGVVKQVPVGIDPGFDYNPGAVDRVSKVREVLVDKAPSIAPRPEPKVDDLPSYLAVGQQERRRMIDRAGGDPRAPDFPQRLRQEVMTELTDEHDAGGEYPLISADSDDAAVSLVELGALLFPGSWVKRANRVPMKVVSLPTDGSRRRGGYRVATDRDITRQVGDRTVVQPAGVALLEVSDDLGSAVHEYTHHLQHQHPMLDRYFQQLHRARTAGDAILPLKRYGTARGRKDDYVDPYAGREYAHLRPPFNAMEVMPQHFQMLFHPVHGEEMLGDLATEDPEMLGLLLATLFHYDPTR